jgi:hypothetical protein
VSAASASPPQFLSKVFSCTSATFNNLEKRLFWNGPRSIPSVVVMSMWLKPQEFVLERNSITAAASRSRFAPRFWAAWVLHRNWELRGHDTYPRAGSQRQRQAAKVITIDTRSVICLPISGPGFQMKSRRGYVSCPLISPRREASTLIVDCFGDR